MAKSTTGKAEPLTLLIVEDQAGHRRALEAHFSKTYHVLTAEHGERAVELASQQPIHLAIIDLILPGAMHGLELLQKILQMHPNARAILITARPTVRTAVQALKNGAIDYIEKPVDLEELKAKVDSAAEQYRQTQQVAQPSQQPSDTLDLSGIVGNSAPMQEVYQMIRKVASSNATVLIRGESGTGKELVAKAIHRNSSRAKGPFIAVSCAALPETLLESELFGHEKSAFTGATTQRQGRFELAHGGTLFLDEIGEVSLAIQVKLLRVLQEHAFERLGGNKTIKVDVRLIAATNKDLKQMVEQRTFREDLYYRLHVIEIYLPPLRERREDIPLLVEHFLRRYNEENGRRLQAATPEALEALMRYHWPGNVRELENTIERAVVLADPDAEWLTPDLLPRSITAA
ncbi:MAG: sigma-54 dependent transcriptional regulator [Armatimonadota bacterium]|nr:sigma-54 dependent transcriptional regulator [bacterium]MCS7309768.1 sigma-54 dependent transcriptional regulator [Armatimonadota bacterium]MDW8104028.1 sigma-54 dependent transcriptional regulator [Armatimonadota bacterium]MDW8290069.1 sigma-54 dependent transcriptional regulator [Armatimonadota bacterium]